MRRDVEHLTLILIFLVKLFHSPFNLLFRNISLCRPYNETVPFYIYRLRQCYERSIPFKDVLNREVIAKKKNPAHVIVRIQVKNCCRK